MIYQLIFLGKKRSFENIDLIKTFPCQRKNFVEQKKVIYKIELSIDVNISEQQFSMKTLKSNNCECSWYETFFPWSQSFNFTFFMFNNQHGTAFFALNSHCSHSYFMKKTKTRSNVQTSFLFKERHFSFDDNLAVKFS